MGMTPEYAECRSWGHSWKPYDVRQEGGTFTVRLECNRCQTTRSQELRSNGDRLKGSRYSYPTGYHVPGGFSRAQARLLFIDNALEDQGVDSSK